MHGRYTGRELRPPRQRRGIVDLGEQPRAHRCHRRLGGQLVGEGGPLLVGGGLEVPRPTMQVREHALTVRVAPPHPGLPVVLLPLVLEMDDVEPERRARPWRRSRGLRARASGHGRVIEERAQLGDTPKPRPDLRRGRRVLVVVDVLPTAKAGGFLPRDGNVLPRECSVLRSHHDHAAPHSQGKSILLFQVPLYLSDC